MKNWQVEVLGLLLPGPAGFKPHLQGRQERGKNEKKPGTQRPPCQEGDNSGFPRLPKSHGTFFNLPVRKSPNTCPERSVAFFTASAAERASIAAAGNQRPASPYEPSGQRPAFARSQGRWPLSPIRRATLPSVGCGRLAVSP